MSFDITKSNGKILTEKRNSGTTTERSDSTISGEGKMDGGKNENVEKELKSSISENESIVNSEEQMADGGKEDHAPTGSKLLKGNLDDKLRLAVDVVVGYSTVSDETKERLKCAVIDVYHNLMTDQEACQCYQLAVPYFQTYYKMVQKVLNRASTEKQKQINNSVKERLMNDLDLKDEGQEESFQASNEENNGADDGEVKEEKKNRKIKSVREFAKKMKEIDKERIDECIYECCGASIKRIAKRDAIRKAVALVIKDGNTGVDAARATNLTPRTVMKYVYAVRDALIIPKQEQVYDKEGDLNEDSFLEQVTDTDREVAKLLLDEKLGHIEPDDFLGSVSELESKVDKLLREFNYNGDSRKICAAIIGVFVEQKKPSDVCKLMELPITVLSSYIRLIKGLILAEGEVKKHTNASNSSILPRVREKQCLDGEKQFDKSSVLVKHVELESVAPSKRKRKSENILQTSRGVFSGKIDVLTLHLESGEDNEEQLIKNIISYLISQQYRRSEVAQTNLQICLEHVLLDGLSVAETLKIHEGPNEGVLEIYQKRCRDVFSILTVEFPVFIAAISSLNDDGVNRLRKKKPRISHKKSEDTKSVSTSDSDVVAYDTVQEIFASIPEKAKTVLDSYIMKLLDANFPLEKRLVGGLLQMIAEKLDMKYVLADKVLEDVVEHFHEKHNRHAT